MADERIKRRAEKKADQEKRQKEADQIMLENRTTLEAILIAAMRDSGKSVYAIARQSGVSDGQLSRFLRGERMLSMESLDKLCTALNLTLAPKTGTYG